MRLAAHKSFRIIWPRQTGEWHPVWRGNDRAEATKKKERQDEWSGNVYNRYPVEMVINQFSWRKSVSAASFKGTRAKIKNTLFSLSRYFLSFVALDLSTQTRCSALLFVIHIFVPNFALFVRILHPFFLLLYWKKKKKNTKKKKSYIFFRVFFFSFFSTKRKR